MPTRIWKRLHHNCAYILTSWQFAGRFTRISEMGRCLDLGKALMDMAPEHPLDVNYFTIALHKLGRTDEAWKLASAKLLRFENDWQLHYNDACYAAQLGFIEESRELFQLALDLADDKERIRQAMLDDPDLQAMRKRFNLQ